MARLRLGGRRNFARRSCGKALSGVSQGNGDGDHDNQYQNQTADAESKNEFQWTKEKRQRIKHNAHLPQHLAQALFGGVTSERGVGNDAAIAPCGQRSPGPLG